MAELVSREPLLQAYRDLNASFVDMVGALSVLRSLSTISLAELSEQELLAQAMEALVLNQDLERCSVFLREGEILVNAGGMDWSDLIGLSLGKHPAGRSFRLGEGFVGLAAKTGEVQHCRNCLTDPRFAGQTGSTGGLGSLVAVPIRTNGEILGVLNVSHPHTEFFSVEHERALVVFANFLGQMIVSRRLLTQMDQLVKERTGELEKALADAEALKSRYAEMSSVDELTGLYNRRHFFPAARTALACAVRGNTSFSLLLLDIDHFKQINDTFGHSAGDQVLCQFAFLLRDVCRASDVIARFGGEEFIIALPETDADGARMLAERIRLGAKAWQGVAGGRPMRITVSLGVSALSTDNARGQDATEVLEHLISEADQALYFGKQQGRDQHRLYSEIACHL